MALKVATLTGIATTAALAFCAEQTAVAAPSTSEAKEDVGPTDALRVEGLGRFSCISRGPAAPPMLPHDWDALFSEVPT